MKRMTVIYQMEIKTTYLSSIPRILYRFMAISVIWNCLFMTNVSAQVTFGSLLEPIEGALLDLKSHIPDKDNATATKGVMCPRLYLNAFDDLKPIVANPSKDDKSAHSGLVVYNLSNANGLTEGMYVWTGIEWKKIDDSLVVAPQIGALLPGSATLSPEIFIAGSVYNGVLRVPYWDGNGGSYGYSQFFDSNSGFIITLLGGTLNVGMGELIYYIGGTPKWSSSAAIELPVSFLDKSGTATVGGSEFVSKPLEFAKKISKMTDNITPMKLGHLTLKYKNKGGVAHVTPGHPDYAKNCIEFSVDEDMHLSYYFEKIGVPECSQDYQTRYGRIAAKKGEYYVFDDGNVNGNGHWFLDVRSRCVASAIFVLQHNDIREMYRAFFNVHINTALKLQNYTGHAYADESVGIFIEKLQ